MSPQEIDGIAAAVTRAIDEARAELRAEHARAIAELRREHDDALAAVRRDAEQLARSQEQRVEREEARAGQLQRDLDAVRQSAAEPAIHTALMDAEGVLHIVQRSGQTLHVRIANVQDLVAAAVADGVRDVEARATTRLDAAVARALQDMGLAPPWSPVAAYTAGDVVSCYVGRTYRLVGSVKASIGQEPGDHPDVWERIGSHGLRVHKSKPAQLVAGDVFTEADARFIHDGVTTTLLSPKGVKASDVERAIKPVHALAQSAADQARMTRSDLEGLQTVVRAASQAANDAQAWIKGEGDQAVVRSAETQAWCANRALLIDSPALARIVERADDIDGLLDREAG